VQLPNVERLAAFAGPPGHQCTSSKTVEINWQSRAWNSVLTATGVGRNSMHSATFATRRKPLQQKHPQDVARPIRYV
jgi:hypothetical protein